MQKFYITTPIYYVNDVPHIGHASTNLIADMVARFKRLDGFEVKFLTGTDEHGQKIEKSAAKAGLLPQEFTDEVSKSFVKLCEVMNFSNDDFIRTTELRHKQTVIEIWNKLLENGSIYLGKYEGWYAVSDEAFYSASEIVDGKAPSGSVVEWVEEPSYFFNLSAWQEKLLKHFEENPNFIIPANRMNEVLSFVKGGLTDLSVSRTSFSWGIKVPNDEKHVIYVWLDALVNYLSAVKKGEAKEFWPCDLHILGKDILRFHAVYWPAFLMAAGIDLPKKVFAHGWWTVEESKISKSKGNAIDPLKFIQEYNLDYLRYFLLRDMPYANDKDFSLAIFTARINADLCNNIGNLIQRVLAFVNKYLDGIIPEAHLIAEDKKLLELAYTTINVVRTHIDTLQLNSAVESIVNLASRANEYIDMMAPWSLKTTDVARMGTVLYTLLECIRVIGILLQPIVPDSAGRILDFIKCEDRLFKALTKKNALKAGNTIMQSEGIFPRIEIKS